VELIARELALDVAFRDRAATPAAIAAATAQIGGLQGQLRAVHLTAHLETRALLNAEQVELYENLRGYGASGTAHQRYHHER
jgi:hypothetical protein